MPRDFKAYTDPGIYIELIDPPVNNNTSITPTVVALIGSASEEGRAIKDSVLLTDQYSSALSARGIDPFSLIVRDQYNQARYANAAIGRVSADVVETEESAQLFVDKRSGFVLPVGIANSNFEADYRLNINGRVYDATVTASDDTSYTFEITGAGGLGVAYIEAGSIVNLNAGYVKSGVKVGKLQATLASGFPTTKILQYPNTIQLVRVAKSATSASIAYGETSADLYADGDFVTAKTLADSLTDLGAIVIRTSTTVDDVDYFDYVIVLGVSGAELFTTEDSDVEISARGLIDGDSIQVDSERLTLRDFQDQGNNEIEFSLTRGADGTQDVQHGAIDVYFVAGYDYLVSVEAGDQLSLNGVDDVTLLDSVAGGRLSGTPQYVQITGRSTDARQFAPESFRDLDNIRIKYGKPLSSDATPSILSNLTLAAQVALRNGADRVYCVAVEHNTVEGFEDAIAKLEGIEDINVIVPVTAGLTSAATEQVVSTLVDFVESQAGLGNLVRGFVGLDGRVNTVNYSDFSSLAARIHNSRISLVAPSRFGLQTASGKLTVGGPFAAAAVAGLHANLGPQEPLTRKQLELSLFSVEDRLTNREMLDLQAGGVLVIAQESGRPLYIRHGLTTDTTSVYSREVSIVASRDRLRDLVYDALLSAGILGSPITANTPEVVVGNIIGALEVAKSSTLIFDYSDVKYRIPTNNPTAMEIRFAYRPTMPLNYILIQFSVDTTSSAVTFQSINEGGI